ncbi:BspC domain-containing protein [Pseudochrobactrum sp. HB0163]|uniref:BspC domain-containing protein n=1 Tax=Pseudochrobactrum sp. HB0163 TaxID=3450708 RepID=UPI003F6DE6C6
MLKTTYKSSAVFFMLLGLSTLAAAETLPKQSPDFKANYKIAINDNKAAPAVALCSATTHDLTRNKTYKYDRFGFTQGDYDAVKTSRNANGTTTVKLSGEARQRSGDTGWDSVTVECTVSKNKVRSISVSLKK